MSDDDRCPVTINDKRCELPAFHGHGCKEPYTGPLMHVLDAKGRRPFRWRNVAREKELGVFYDAGEGDR